MLTSRFPVRTVVSLVAIASFIATATLWTSLVPDEGGAEPRARLIRAAELSDRPISLRPNDDSIERQISGLGEEIELGPELYLYSPADSERTDVPGGQQAGTSEPPSQVNVSLADESETRAGQRDPSPTEKPQTTQPITRLDLSRGPYCIGNLDSGRTFNWLCQGFQLIKVPTALDPKPMSL